MYITGKILQLHIGVKIIDNTKLYKTVDRCRCCGNEGLVKYLDLGDQPLANAYHSGQEQPVFPFKAMLCQKCFHSQLSIVVDPDIMFKNYLYVSGTTKTLHKHFEDFAQYAIHQWMKIPRTYERSGNISVLDIACNDGTLLEKFKDLGCYVAGVDPAENLAEITKEKDIPVTVDYWSMEVAEKLVDKIEYFDIITAANVFAHVDDLLGFLQACAAVLLPGGIIVLEFPYAKNLFVHGEFDTMYHEHLSYFLIKPFAHLARLAAMKIVAVEETEIHGGSIRITMIHNPMPLCPSCISAEEFSRGGHVESVKDLEVQEKELGLHSIDTYQAFTKQIENNMQHCKNVIANTIRDMQGCFIVGYGAAAKGNTVLNAFPLPLSFIVDDNEMKHGLKTPGQDIPIMSVSALDMPEPLCIVVLAWNFYDEIKERIRIVRNRPKQKTTLIRYLPTFLVEKL